MDVSLIKSFTTLEVSNPIKFRESFAVQINNPHSPGDNFCGDNPLRTEADTLTLSAVDTGVVPQALKTQTKKRVGNINLVFLTGTA